MRRGLLTTIIGILVIAVSMGIGGDKGPFISFIGGLWLTIGLIAMFYLQRSK